MFPEITIIHVMLPFISVSEPAKPQPRQPSRPRPQQPERPHRDPRPSGPPLSNRYLHRSYGLGFGTGEILVKVPKPGVQEVAEVVEVFLPTTLENPHVTRPYETKCVPGQAVPVDPKYEYRILEVTNDVLNPPSAQYVNSRSALWWQEFNDHNFPMTVTSDQQAMIAAFTGVLFKLKHQLKPKAHEAPAPRPRLETEKSGRRHGHYKHGALDDVDVSRLKRQLRHG